MIVDEETIRRTLDVYQDHMPGDVQLADAVKARVRSDRRKRLAVVSGVMSAVTLVGAAVALDARTSTSDEVASQVEPPGKAVGESLGLEPVAWPADGCKQYVGYEPRWGFCLDDYTDDETELVLTSQEIMGYEMTEARVAYVSAIIELRDYWRPTTPEDQAKAAELKAIIDETKPLLEPLYEPLDLADFEGLEGVGLADAAGLIPTRGVPVVGVGAMGFSVDNRQYDLDGVASDEGEAAEWASRISGRDVRREVMPDVVGMTEPEAIAVLEATGFTDIRVGRAPAVDNEEGTVVSQAPKAGDKHPRAFWVRILVSKGNAP